MPAHSKKTFGAPPAVASYPAPRAAAQHGAPSGSTAALADDAGERGYPFDLREHYGLPRHLPSTLDLTSARAAELAAMSHLARTLHLFEDARRDFHAKFNVIGQYRSLGGGAQHKALGAWGHLYMLAAVDAYLRLRAQEWDFDLNEPLATASESTVPAGAVL